MSRSGYSDEYEYMDLYRATVRRTIAGKRGQAFLTEMLTALDAMPNKRLVDNDLERDGEVCAIGSVGKARGVDMSDIDPENPDDVAEAFGISRSLAAEIAFLNDEEMEWGGKNETPEQRFVRIRQWLVDNIAAQAPSAPTKGE